MSLAYGHVHCSVKLSAPPTCLTSCVLYTALLIDISYDIQPLCLLSYRIPFLTSEYVYCEITIYVLGCLDDCSFVSHNISDRLTTRPSYLTVDARDIWEDSGAMTFKRIDLSLW